MKNFDWKDEHPDKQGAPDGDPQPTPPAEIERLSRLAGILDLIYNILNWFQMGVAIMAAFAWLWQTDKAPFTTFLFFALYAVEKAVDLIEASMDWTVNVYIGGDGDDDGNNGNNGEGKE